MKKLLGKKLVRGKIRSLPKKHECSFPKITLFAPKKERKKRAMSITSVLFFNSVFQPRVAKFGYKINKELEKLGVLAYFGNLQKHGMYIWKFSRNKVRNLSKSTECFG
jgi:hypothetical protein